MTKNIKIFITVVIPSKELEHIELKETKIGDSILKFTEEMIKADVQTQLRITNMPPRGSEP